MSTELDIRQQLASAFQNTLSSISLRDLQIENQTRKVLNEDNLQTAVKEALILSFLIIEYRAYLSGELSRVTALEASSINEQSKALVKKHINIIQQHFNRLTDLRQDLELVQKLSYSNRIYV